MKKVILFSVLFIFAAVGSTALAQQRTDKERKESFERFKAERKAFITKEVGLTEEESQAFLPLCDELQLKKFEAGKELRELRHKIRENAKEGKKITEEEYKKLVELNAAIKIKEAQLEKEYIDKFLQVLSAEKVHRYQRAEQEFARKTVDKRNHREQK